LNKYDLQQREEIGKKLLSKELRRQNTNLKTFIKNKELSRIAEELGYKKEEEVYSAIAQGQISPRQIAAKLLVESKPSTQSSILPQKVSLSIQKAVDRYESIKIKGYNDFLFYLARCCNPLPGEDIVGFITRGKGIAIHSVDCPNVKRLLYHPEREIEVKWELDKDVYYPVKISLHLEDRPGVVANITAKIADAKINIKNIETKTFNNKRALIHLVLDIKNVKQLDKIIKALKKIDGIYDIERI